MKLRIFGIVICLITLALPAAAHPVPFSYLDLRLRPTALDVSLIVHIFDVGHDINIAPPERLLESNVVAGTADAIRSLVAARVELLADDQLLAAAWSAPQIIEDRQSLLLTTSYPLTGIPGRITIRVNMFPYDPNHQTFINVYEGEDLTSQ